jgi:hypothetical protein
MGEGELFTVRGSLDLSAIAISAKIRSFSACGRAKIITEKFRASSNQSNTK